MTKTVSPQSALERAVAQMGSQAALARLCGVTQPSVWGWLRKMKELPAEFVLTVEAATGISRHDLRPDIYPIETNTAGPEAAGILPSSPAGPAVGSACPTAGRSMSGEAA